MAGASTGKKSDHDPGRIALVALKLAGWLLLLAAACMFGLAKPEPTTFYDRVYYTKPRQEWNMDLIQHTGPFLLAGIGCTLLGLVVYLSGVRRRKYGFPVSLVVTGLLSAALYAYLNHSYGL